MLLLEHDGKELLAAHGLPVAVHINGGNGVDYAPTFAGHAGTYPGYAAFMPLNSFVHLATLIIEGVFGRQPDLRFVFADGGYDLLTPLMWRLNTFWMSMRDQTPWVDKYPSEYLPGQVRYCTSAFDSPTDDGQAERCDPLGVRRQHGRPRQPSGRIQPQDECIASLDAGGSGDRVVGADRRLPCRDRKSVV